SKIQNPKSKIVLVPLDGSPLAERALPAAQAIAAASGAQLVLVRVALETQAAVDEAEAYLDSVAGLLAERGIAAERVVPFGDAGGAIVAEARLQRANLVVMATHGHAGPGRSSHGSVVEAVLAQSQVPVLLVPTNRPELPDPESNIQNPKSKIVLVPLDGSAFAEEALPVAEALVEALRGKLVLLRVVPSLGALASRPHARGDACAPRDGLHAEALDYLRHVADRRSLPPETVRVEARVGEPAEAIAAAGRDHCASLIAMSTHGRTGLGRLPVGSVAGAVLQQGELPLLLVRPLALQRMLDALGAHIAAETDSLAAYRQLAETIPDPMVALLLRLVIDDEERHHRLLARMAGSLCSDLRWARAAEALPTGPARRGEMAAEAVAALEAFIQEEQEGARHLRHLACQEAHFHDGLFALLLEVMAMDSEKHERVLHFVLERLLEPPRRRDAESQSS
ncbi:MAG: universal stress protein, partial [Chloroflexi bacterium]|nr:universal stress protein [Chloroflexota bacterium]